jgi:hypothetical protein
MNLPRLCTRLAKLEDRRRPAVIAGILRRAQQCANGELGAFLLAELTRVDRTTALAIMDLTFRTLFRTSEAIFSRAFSREGGNYIQTMSCAATHCCYTTFSLITTSCKLRGPFPTLWGEPQGFGFPAGRTLDDNQAPCLEGMQTMTDVALVPWQGSHQILMTTRDHAAGALMVRR